MNDRVHPAFQPALDSIYDAADEMREGDEVDECALAKDWRQQQDDEREMRLAEALDACKQAGVPDEHLKTLAFETGATFWASKEKQCN